MDKRIDVLEAKIEALEKRLVLIEGKSINNDNKQDFDFDKYRETIDKNDIEKLMYFRSNGCIKWFYFIPILGVYFYSYFYGKAVESLDRGFARRELYKWNTLYTLAFFPFLPFMIVLNFVPIITKYLTIPKVLKMHKLKIEQEKLNSNTKENPIIST